MTPERRRNRAAAILIGAVALLSAHAGLAQTKLTVIVFPGLQNLPIFAAQENGFFAKRGLNLELVPTPNSEELRTGLAAGRYDLAHSAVDNAVAMAEHANVDVVVLMGGDNGFNNLYVLPEIKSYADLRGKTLAVDALDTAYAFQLYAILAMNGVPQGSYTAKPVGGTALRLKSLQDGQAAAAMMNPPFSIVAEKTGIKKMTSATQVLGAYQGNSAFALRSWAPAHRDTIEHYIQAYIEGLRWAFNPANKDKAVAMLKDRLKLDQDVAAQAYAVGAEGTAKDAKIDRAGFQNVLKLRADMHGDWDGKPPSPDKYLDLSYYDKAMSGL